MKINHRSIGKTEPTGRWFCIAGKNCRMTEEIKISNVYRQYFFVVWDLLDIQLQAQLRPAIAIKAGIYFLDPGHGITAWNIRAFREEGQSLPFQLSIQISDDLRQSTFSVNEMFAGIFQKQRQGCSLLGVDQLLHIAEIHFGFSKRKAIFAVNFGFQSFRPFSPW